MESDMRKKEAEEKAIAEIAGSSENNIGKGKRLLRGVIVICLHEYIFKKVRNFVTRKAYILKSDDF